MLTLQVFKSIPFCLRGQKICFLSPIDEFLTKMHACTHTQTHTHTHIQVFGVNRGRVRVCVCVCACVCVCVCVCAFVFGVNRGPQPEKFPLTEDEPAMVDRPRL